MASQHKDSRGGRGRQVDAEVEHVDRVGGQPPDGRARGRAPGEQVGDDLAEPEQAEERRHADEVPPRQPDAGANGAVADRAPRDGCRRPDESEHRQSPGRDPDEEQRAEGQRERVDRVVVDRERQHPDQHQPRAEVTAASEVGQPHQGGGDRETCEILSRRGVCQDRGVPGVDPVRGEERDDHPEQGQQPRDRRQRSPRTRQGDCLLARPRARRRLRPRSGRPGSVAVRHLSVFLGCERTGSGWWR